MENLDMDGVNPKGNADRPAAESRRNSDLIPEVPPSVEHRSQTTHCKPDQTPLWKIILESGAVAVGIVVAGIYYGQLVVMRGQLGEIIRQYPEIQRSAQAARDSADRSRETLNETIKNFMADQRAWIGIVTMKPDNPKEFPYSTTFTYVYTNYGKSPANDVITTDNAYVYGEKFPASPFYQKQMPTPELNSKGPVFPGQKNELDGSAYICQLQIDEIRRGKTWCYTYGVITYKDEFGFKHTTHFCFRHGVNPLGHSTVLCDTYNDAD
jgi:hypothetical protein